MTSSQQDEAAVLRSLNKKRLLATLLVSAIAASMVLPSSVAVAQAPPAGAESLTVSPPLIEVDAVPGRTLEQTISIDNNGEVARTVAVSIQNFGAAGEEGQPDLTDEEGVYSLKSWMEFSPQSATIKSKDRQEFKIKIRVPDNAPPGGHYGAVIFEAANIETPEGANLTVVPRVTSLILLKVPGDVVERAGVASFTASKVGDVPEPGQEAKGSNFFQRGPVTFHTRVRNDGNVHIKPTVKVEVFNIFGSKIDTLEAEPGNVLPDSIRRFETEWKNKTLFGYYKAKTTVTYGSTGQVVTAEDSFWAAPLLVMALGIATVIALGLLFWLPRKRIKKAVSAFKNG